ncbi:hypothetical protein P8452_51129 [Trifolium repens]|nr:hypothetical protein P8452_51129 [Trifolium repens]
MGKERYWVGKSYKKSVIVEENETKTTPTPPSGCMCAVFQFFDFHPFHFPNTINHQQEVTSSCISKDHTTTTTTVPKGAEAPRNSLESKDGTVSASLSKEENFKIPMNIQIKTKRSNGGNLTDLSSEISTSPGAKTPTLVARLIWRKIDENNFKSPSQHAKQIVKQVKESVASRKVGQDITNTFKNKQDIGTQQNFRASDNLLAKDQLQTREEILGLLRIKKSPKTTTLKDSNPSSCSQRIRFIENKHKPNTTSKDKNTKPKAYALKEEQESRDKKLVTKCKKDTNEKFSSSRFKRPPQTSDINICPTSNSRANDIKSNVKSKKTQSLSSNLLNNINVVQNALSIKTESSPLATKIHQKQSQVSEIQCCLSQRYKQEGTATLSTQETRTNVIEDKFNGVSTIETHKTEFQYITEILNKHVTTTTRKNVSFNTWFSTKHPLDPSIFNHLEHNFDNKDRNFTTKNQLGHRWNRKLMFDLVDEVLLEILKQKFREKKLCFSQRFCDRLTITELTERVWNRVGEFPCAKCEVLDDIDNLIESEDMKKLINVEHEEEKEDLVMEIEGNILDTLMYELFWL